MQVTCGAEWVTDKGDKRSYAMALDLDDLREMHGDEFVKTLAFNDKRKALNNACDALVVAYLANEGAIDKNYARARIEELRNG